MFGAKKLSTNVFHNKQVITIERLQRTCIYSVRELNTCFATPIAFEKLSWPCENEKVSR